MSQTKSRHLIGPKVTVTKIKFSELPAGRVLADGSHAAPIGEWLGGLETTNPLSAAKKHWVVALVRTRAPTLRRVIL